MNPTFSDLIFSKKQNHHFWVIQDFGISRSVVMFSLKKSEKKNKKYLMNYLNIYRPLINFTNFIN